MRYACILYRSRPDLHGQRTPSANHRRNEISNRGTPKSEKKCSTMSQTADTQRLNTCPHPAIVAATCTSVKCRLVSLTDCPTTPYDAAGRVHGRLRKSKGGLNSVLSPIRKTPQRRNPLSHNTFRHNATPTNREISILEQETDRKCGALQASRLHHEKPQASRLHHEKPQARRLHHEKPQARRLHHEKPQARRLHHEKPQARRLHHEKPPHSPLSSPYLPTTASRVAPMIFRSRRSTGEDSFGKSSGLPWQQEDCIGRWAKRW